MIESRCFQLQLRKQMVIMLALLFILVSCGHKSDNKKSATLAFSKEPFLPKGIWITAKRESLYKYVPVVGSFQASQTTRLGPQISARVKKVYVDVGNMVRKGDRLVLLDPIFFKLAVNQAEIAVKAAKARIKRIKQSLKLAEVEIKSAQIALDYATLQFNRMKNLWKKPKGRTPSVPQKLYDEASFNYKEAKVRVESAKVRTAEIKTSLQESVVALQQAKEKLRYAKQQLKETVILAPYDGIVTKRFVDPGEPVRTMPLTYLLEIQEIKTLKLVFPLSQSMVDKVHPGTAIEWEVYGMKHSKGKGKIELIYPAIDRSTRTLRCRARIDNSNLLYKPGILAQVRVIVEAASNVLTVPSQALRKKRGNWEVLVKKANKIMVRYVKIGLATETKVEIEEGVEEGEEIFVPSTTEKYAG